MTKNSKFNLLDEPWISVVYTDGHACDVSITTLLQQAPQIREISGDIPQQTLPLLRLILAILYRSYTALYNFDGSDEQKMVFWKAVWDQGGFDVQALEEYLDSVHDRFYLIDDDAPFMQVAGLEYVGDKEYDDVAELIADIPKPDKFLFSMRAKGTIKDVSLSEAARWLVFMQTYDVGGIKTPVVGNTHVNKGKVYAPKGRVGTGWLGAIGGTFLEGRNLFETLMLNWCLVGDSKRGETPLIGDERDTAPWEREPAGPDITMRDEPRGVVDLLTWQSRRVRLVPDATIDKIIGVISCYGDVLTAVNKQTCEMMTAWRTSVPQQKKLNLPSPPFMPRTLDSSRALWRNLEPMLKIENDSRRPGVLAWMDDVDEQFKDAGEALPQVTIHTQSMTYGTQSSVYADGIDDRLDINAALLQPEAPEAGEIINSIVEVVQLLEQCVKDLAGFVGRIRTAGGDRSDGASTDVKEFAYGQLDGMCRQRISRFAPDCDIPLYETEWKQDAHKLLRRIGQHYLSDDAQGAVFREFDDKTMKNGAHMSAAKACSIYFNQLRSLLGPLKVSEKGEQTEDTNQLEREGD
ncbi:type I-E CRISPR-associated protein Cse1/CasA [Bifidobacterium sp. ESL0784]|uniref:type I-E CRISPR-associated protein Cse1/CasA n=1 Tax=Bifidobacterium sp. ESL0784 TaxID=2983231 RepID=UPI0023F8E771|nr:type I-E CRISPR-associated protein Cse1/CasA [Bifidobacterium sp. ESL0784]MDF7641708.1 type I-E CRISPR-associated protein Cse1/CasA [Bifidobacterium sp. ESL0784]